MRASLAQNQALRKKVTVEEYAELHECLHGLTLAS